jgi:hypothetical protein
VLAALALPAVAEEKGAAGKLAYRGFTVDTAVLKGKPNAAAVEASLKHQLDIVADSGAKADILAFFRSEPITLTSGLGDEGHFNGKGKGITIADKAQPPQKPVVLHELLHAYHYRAMPQGQKNPDVLAYYNRAKDNGLYPAKEYLLKNPFEFFAVTGSLYLWGNVDREPRTRDKLKAKQPNYYVWLGELFGVEK